MMADTIVYLNFIRFITGLLILSYASYSDIKTRKASNFLWIIISFIGISLLIIQFITNNISNIMYLIFIPIMIIIFYFLFQILPFFGGADVKALMSLVILVPFIPNFYIFPIVGSILPFPWIILSNSVFIYLAIPISLFIYNIYKKNFDFPKSFLGYKIDLTKARNSFVWPLEDFVNGKRKISYFLMNKDVDNIYNRFQEEGISRIWVTPKIPFMIPLLFGFILSFIIGDILFFLMSFLF